MLVANGPVPVFPTPVAHRGHCTGKTALGRDVPDNVLPFRDRPRHGQAEEVEAGTISPGWRAPFVICARNRRGVSCRDGARSPNRAKRLPRTASTRLASTILSNVMIASSANRARVLSPLRRGLTSVSNGRSGSRVEALDDDDEVGWRRLGRQRSARRGTFGTIVNHDEHAALGLEGPPQPFDPGQSTVTSQLSPFAASGRHRSCCSSQASSSSTCRLRGKLRRKRHP